MTTAPAPSRPAPDALSILREHGATTDAALRAVRTRYPDAPPRLLDAIDYSLLAGGKRLRPALILETCRACGGDPAANRSAVASACAMELIHTFSLVHDDLPAMDDDDLRRGRPTNHKVYGEAMAILAGDAMTTAAFEVIAADADPAVAAQLVVELARAAGPSGMIGGQVLDIDGENQSLSLAELQRIHRLKTGALLTASCRMGAISAARANHAAVEAVTAFGRHLGLAFQIIDDVLDVTSTPEQMGKATNKDAGKGKNTYPGLLGLDASRKMATDELAAAMASLDPLGPAAEGLRSLARFVVDRNT
ncbi:MAG TPA: farnesyl diphosphate synthase [Humisphaera sp.]